MTSSSQTPGRTYQDAIAALNSLQSNAATIEAARAAPKSPSVIFADSLYYLRRLGYSLADLSRLHVIHITGTKGKGSTAAFASSLLNHLAPHVRVGLFTSPHLVAVRERIRINGDPIDESVFARYFWEVWDAFADGHGEPLNESIPLRPSYFRYLTYLTYHLFLSPSFSPPSQPSLLILEVGIGGTLDSTNLVPAPLAAGVTSLGLDHTAVLGGTIGEIAGHKGGIYKRGAPALTVDGQPPVGLEVLKLRAAEAGASSFNVVPIHPALQPAYSGSASGSGFGSDSSSPIQLGLRGSHQRSNASLAVALVSAVLNSDRRPSFLGVTRGGSEVAATATIATDVVLPSEAAPTARQMSAYAAHQSPDGGVIAPPPVPKDVVAPKLEGAWREGLENARWPGRCQVVADPRPAPAAKPCGKEAGAEEGSAAGGGVVWALDGAHTRESLGLCGGWFREAFIDPSAGGEADASTQNDGAGSKQRRVLVFNCTMGRSGKDLLDALVAAASEPESVPGPGSDTAAVEVAGGGGGGGERARRRPAFDEAVFCTNVTYRSGFKGDLVARGLDGKRLAALTLQRELAAAWRGLTGAPEASTHVVGSIEEAVEIVRRSAEHRGGDGDGDGSARETDGGTVALVTGSLHLVGGLMDVARLHHAL